MLAEARRTSQVQAAARFGVTQQTVSRWAVRAAAQRVSQTTDDADAETYTPEKRARLAAQAFRAAEQIIAGVQEKAAAILARDNLTAKDLRDLAVAGGILADKGLALGGREPAQRFGSSGDAGGTAPLAPAYPLDLSPLLEAGETRE